MEKLDLASKLPYVRDRLVENYFWAVSVFFEPYYSLGRIICTKMIEILAITDDTYDAYGTFDELGLYTNAVQGYELYLNRNIYHHALDVEPEQTAVASISTLFSD